MDRRTLPPQDGLPITSDLHPAAREVAGMRAARRKVLAGLGAALAGGTLAGAAAAAPAVAAPPAPAGGTGWASPQDFGARGDGRTDDTDALRRLAASGASLVFFPPGTYPIADTITWPTHYMRVEGSVQTTRNSVVLGTTPGMTLFAVTGWQCGFSRIGLEGDGAVKTGEGATMTGIAFVRPNRTGVDLTLDRCYVTRMKTGILLRGNGNRVMDSVISACMTGIAFEDALDLVKPYEDAAAQPEYRRNIVSGNIFHVIQGDDDAVCIRVASDPALTWGHVIRDNWADACRRFFAGHLKDGVLTGNVMTRMYGGRGGGLENAAIIDIQRPAGGGDAVAIVSGNLVQGKSHADRSNSIGIRVSADDVSIVGNAVIATTREGVVIDGARAIVANNRVVLAGFSALRPQAKAFQRGRFAAITIDGPDAEIDGNVVRSDGRTAMGMLLTGRAAGARMRDAPVSSGMFPDGVVVDQRARETSSDGDLPAGLARLDAPDGALSCTQAGACRDGRFLRLAGTLRADRPVAAGSTVFSLPVGQSARPARVPVCVVRADGSEEIAVLKLAAGGEACLPAAVLGAGDVVHLDGAVFMAV